MTEIVAVLQNRRIASRQRRNMEGQRDRLVSGRSSRLIQSSAVVDRYSVAVCKSAIGHTRIRTKSHQAHIRAIGLSRRDQ